MNKSAVLMLAYGTPDRLADMEAYLLDIRGGRKTPPELVEEMTGRYRRIGGSPLTRLTFAQAEAVEKELSRRGRASRVYVGMRHWTPWIKEAVAAMRQDGIEEAVAIVMAPHYSSLSVGRYMAKVEEAQQEIGSRIKVRFVESWWSQPKFLAAQEKKIRAVRPGREPTPAGKTKLIFSAHSLPQRIVEMGDPYDRQLKANAEEMARRLDGPDWMFAYQSAGASPESWLGPSLEEVIPPLAEQGYRRIVAAPIGFVCDHVEILYDLDIEARELAQRLHLQLERTESMNTDPLFIEAVADAVETTRPEPGPGGKGERTNG